MKKIRAWVFAVLMAVVLCACGEEQEQELADISTVEGDGYVAIIWEERTYVPFCVVSKNDCGALIGYRDGDTSDRVCEYKDYPSNEWIANYLTVDGLICSHWRCSRISPTRWRSTPTHRFQTKWMSGWMVSTHFPSTKCCHN